MARADAIREQLEKVMSDQNKKLVHDFYELAFNQHKPREAAALYIGDHYIQHNPFVPNGAAPFVEYFEGYFKDHPQSHVVFSHIIAEGDLVVLHLNSKADEKDRGRAIVDIFRVEHGKIVEHWDVAQAVPEKTVSGNTMF
jgi:predicted SnoaL-like aldol condensation-catalyzing enzyme